MANKRIELQQYKRYMDLQEEEPNRKTVRTGVLVVILVAIALLVEWLFLVSKVALKVVLSLLTILKYSLMLQMLEMQKV